MAIPYKEALDTLEKMFQTLDRDIIASVLLNNNGKIENSVEQLLKLTEITIIDPLEDQKMKIFTVEQEREKLAIIQSPLEKSKDSDNSLNSTEEKDVKFSKKLQEEEDENFAISLQKHYISKLNNEVLQDIYDEEPGLDPRILQDLSSEGDSLEEADNPQNSSKKPKPEEFGPMPKPIKTSKKSLKEKFKSFFSRKKKENTMGRHDSKKIQDQDYGEIISFGNEEKISKKH